MTNSHFDPPSAMTVGLFDTLWSTFRRDLLIAARTPSQWLNPVWFFLIVVTLFPLSVGPERGTLQLIAPGVIWVGALLALMLSLDSLFAADFRNGMLEQLVLSGAPLTLIVLGKVLAHWVFSGLALFVAAPLLGVFLQLPSSALGVLFVSLALGTLTLSLIGSIGAALTVGVNRGGVLLSLLVIPLTIPILIAGSSAVAAAAVGLAANGQLLLLGAALLLSLVLAPLATSAALRVGVA